jgi:hypothetical protein
MYKLNSTGAMVKQIQEALNIPIDGHYGPKTIKAVKNFQYDNQLVADGITGNKTLEALGILDTDLKLTTAFTTEEGLKIIRHHLPSGEYIKENHNIQNDYIFLHHTAGWNSPYKTIDSWGRDDRGRVATEFVLGGQNIKNNDDEHDGVLLQAFPEGSQGWHLGHTGGYYMNRHSVGIEVCNFGYLTKDNKTYVGTQAHEDQIVDLGFEFRGHSKWHRYSDKQIYALKQWILYVANRDNVDIRKGLIQWIQDEGPAAAFEFHQAAYEGDIKGLLTHTNVRKDKTDMFPQQELIDMLLSL